MQLESATASGEATPPGQAESGSADTRARRGRAEPTWATGLPATKLVVAVHGVGDQYSYATIQSVVRQFGTHYRNPVSVPLGSFHSMHPLCLRPSDRYPEELGDVAFAEVYWANFPRDVVDDRYSLEESKKWARTIVDRLRLSAPKPVVSGRATPNFALLGEVLEEMVQTIAVCDRICALAEKAGLFTFDMRRLLDDYLGDVQVVAEFSSERARILGKFSEVMDRASEACPDVQSIYVVAHSEGTVVALLGMLAAVQAEEPPAWAGKLRGFMTLGSPLDKHLVLWPELFSSREAPAEWRHERIAWHNYYDYGDPIGFALDGTRAWLRRHGWHRVFDFGFSEPNGGVPVDGAGHDHGFGRYPFPGKAHVDYWDDDEVFGHFIDRVVAPEHAEPGSPKLPPRSRRVVSAFCYFVPDFGIIVLAHFAAYILLRPITGIRDRSAHDALAARSTVASSTPAGTPARSGGRAGTLAPPADTPPEPARGTASVTPFHVVGVALLILGVTALARAYRLASKRWIKGVGALCGVAGSAVYAWTFWGTSYAASLLAIPVLGVGVLAARFSWRPGALVIWGTLCIVVAGACVTWGTDVGPLWPVAIGVAAFMYLWWLTVLLIDLFFVWHWYIRHARIQDLIAEVRPSCQAGPPIATAAVHGA